jgi:hypothetical protein
MGIEVVVEDERGSKIASLEDPTNILHRVLPARDEPGYHWLNRVDWYGDTTFNRIQINEVRQELQRLANGTRSPEELHIIQQIDALAAKIESEPHLYLKFYGD